MVVNVLPFDFMWLAPAPIVRVYVRGKEGVSYYCCSKAPVHCFCSNCRLLGGSKPEVVLWTPS